MITRGSPGLIKVRPMTKPFLSNKGGSNLTSQINDLSIRLRPRDEDGGDECVIVCHIISLLMRF